LFALKTDYRIASNIFGFGIFYFYLKYHLKADLPISTKDLTGVTKDNKTLTLSGRILKNPYLFNNFFTNQA